MMILILGVDWTADAGNNTNTDDNKQAMVDCVLRWWEKGETTKLQ